MLGDSIRSFEHFEYLNLSIIDAMGHCSRIRKNVKYRIRKNVENREQRTDREQKIQLQRPLLYLWIVGVSGPIVTNQLKNYKYLSP